ncbi:MAG TPA: hypothetical protein VFO07_19905, partial [Roseiflexaceae bacterium]|nr:hypothetical protein [Roseiflexaceae bacterium]
ILDPPSSILDPLALEGLRRYADLDAFTDWYYAAAVATIVAWLREDGWSLPIYHNLLAAPWQIAGTLADLPGFARATGWLAHNAYTEKARDPFVGGAESQLSFEEYVHYAYWRTRLTKHLSPGLPAFVTEISAAQDFYFAAPFVGGLQAINVCVGAQIRPDNPGIGAFWRWAMEALVRPDGSVRPRFWNAKNPYTLLGAAGADFANARAPADLAIGYSHVPERVGIWVDGSDEDVTAQGLQDAAAGCDHGLRSQILAQRLVRAGADFDVLDLDAATPDDLARYAVVVAPAAAVLARATQAKLAACGNLVLIGEAQVRYDENLVPCDLLGGWVMKDGARQEETNPHPPSPAPLRGRDWRATGRPGGRPGRGRALCLGRRRRHRRERALRRRIHLPVRRQPPAYGLQRDADLSRARRQHPAPARRHGRAARRDRADQRRRGDRRGVRRRWRGGRLAGARHAHQHRLQQRRGRRGAVRRGVAVLGAAKRPLPGAPAGRMAEYGGAPAAAERRAAACQLSDR